MKMNGSVGPDLFFQIVMHRHAAKTKTGCFTSKFDIFTLQDRLNMSGSCQFGFNLLI